MTETTIETAPETPARDTAGVIAPPPTILLAFLLTGLLLHRLLPAPLLPERFRALGGVLIGAGIAGGGWFGSTLIAAETPISTRKPTRRIVTAGPFRFTRNPVYLSFNLIYLGIAILTNNRWHALLWPAMLQMLERGVIEREERYLAAKFGDEYRDYTRRVRRWL